MNAASSILIKVRPGDCLNNIANKGKLKAANIDAREITLLIMNVTNQTRIVNPRTIFSPGMITESPKNTPNVVATPLPPLNLKKIVQLWPQIQLTPIRIQKVSNDRLDLEPRILYRNITGKNPLSISKTNTVIPQPLPNSLRALVAPTFPEPNLRISTPLIKRPKM